MRILIVPNINYCCPKCGKLTELSCIENIRNSPDIHPLKCSACGTGFRKEELLAFTKQKAEAMIKQALSKMQKHISGSSEKAPIQPMLKK
ncbi:hypothetical protein V5Y59_004722 [Salmonella enterica]